MMKLIYMISAIIIATSSLDAVPSENVKKDQSSKEQELRARDAQWLNAIVRRDIVALDHLLAEEVVITDDVGKVHNKAQELKRRNVYTHNTSFNNTIETVHFYGNTAVINGLHTVRVQPPQKSPYWIPYRYTCLWSKRLNRWQIVAQQFTRVAGE